MIILVALGLTLFTGLSYVVLTQQTGTPPLNESGYRDISSEELNSWLVNKDFVLINVHIPYEGEIDGTDIFIPYNEISENLDRLPADKNAKIVIYCMSGRMSAIASAELVQQGYTNILNLDDGMIGWEKSGFTLINR